MKARLSARGMLGCVAALFGIAQSQARLADIVYACDQSGSMELNFVWISPDERDTVYLSSTTGCGYTSNDLNGFGTVIVLSELGTRQVRRINPAKPPLGCGEFSGDPFGQRALVMRAAIDFQSSRSPGSRAGYLGFGSGLLGATPPRTLNSAADVDSVKTGIRIQNSGNTNYQIALDQAKRWLTDPDLSPNPAKAVVFLSDGRPTTPDTAGYLEVLSPSYAGAPGPMPPIYGIFIGNPHPDTARLHELSRLTGGRFFLVPPTRPDSLDIVMKQILGIFLNLDATTGAKMGPEAFTVRTGPITRFSGGTLLFNVGRPVAREMKMSADLLGRLRTLGTITLHKNPSR